MSASNVMGSIPESILNKEEGFVLGDVTYKNNAVQPAIVMVGAAGEDNEATASKMDTLIKGITLKTVTVPAGYKYILHNLRGKRTVIGTDKNLTYGVSITALATGEAVHMKSVIGQVETEDKYPINKDIAFPAGAVITLFMTAEAGAVGLFAELVATFIKVKV